MTITSLYVDIPPFFVNTDVSQDSLEPYSLRKKYLEISLDFFGISVMLINILKKTFLKVA